jgi:hypothetical protein
LRVAARQLEFDPTEWREPPLDAIRQARWHVLPLCDGRPQNFASLLFYRTAVFRSANTQPFLNLLAKSPNGEVSHDSNASSEVIDVNLAEPSAVTRNRFVSPEYVRGRQLDLGVCPKSATIGGRSDSRSADGSKCNTRSAPVEC